MKEMTVQEMRQVQIAILDHIDELCKKNGITYWIDYGTLIGAVRHKGYIPWDDDIDVSMLREDFDRFVKICEEKRDDRYRLSCVENDPECMYPFGKMIDTYTDLYELGEDGIKTGVYVDIFVYDGAPRDKRKLEKGFRSLDFYGRWRKYQIPMKEAPLSIKRIGVLFMRGIFKILPRQFFTRKIVRNAKKYADPDSDNVCALVDPYSYSHWVVKKDIFKELIDLEFEGKKYKAPKAYDEWLTIQYGDYMTIPPKEKQIRHDVKAYYNREIQ